MKRDITNIIEESYLDINWAKQLSKILMGQLGFTNKYTR